MFVYVSLETAYTDELLYTSDKYIYIYIHSYLVYITFILYINFPLFCIQRLDNNTVYSVFCHCLLCRSSFKNAVYPLQTTVDFVHFSINRYDIQVPNIDFLVGSMFKLIVLLSICSCNDK